MRGFGLSVATEAASKASISAAIGVHHQDHPPGAVQAHGLANLLQDKLSVCLVLRRSQALGATGNLDKIGIRHTDALEELSEAQIKSVIEAPENSCVALIRLARRVEVKNLFRDGLLRRFSVVYLTGELMFPAAVRVALPSAARAR
jgi:hypothetical protein